MTPALHVSRPGEPDRRFAGAPLTAGRDPGCDLVLDDPLVSREHCRIEPRDGGWLVTDTSRNGTFAAAAPLHTAVVGPGEHLELRLGDPEIGPALTVRVDAGAGYPLDRGPVTIGRVPDNTVVVDDLLVSRYHARVDLTGPGRAEVTDLGSRNGTYVNGHRVGRSVLHHGDRLAVGRRTFGYDGAAGLVEHEETRHASLAAEHLTVAYGETRVLSDVSFAVEPGTFLAIIGPSGAGKSTLLRALTGARAADEGRALVDGIDFYPAYDEVRHRIGLVPQDDVLHDQLTVGQALGYAAALRLPDDVPAAARAQRVGSVLAQLDLTERRDLPIHRLSGGQRKRASVAMELLTEPSLLYLDEPTSGLDPLLDREVMRGLRGLADRGRTVVVVTHSTLQLHLCDRVLVLARGGRVAYFGPPADLLAHFGAADYADAFTALSDEATVWARRYATGVQARVAPPPPAPGLPLPPRQSRTRQFGLLLHRAAALALADKRQLALLAGLPLFLAAVVQTAPASAGLALRPGEPPQLGAATLLVILVIGAAFTGMAASVRELVAERPVYQREWAVGLRPGVYLLAKVTTAVVLCLGQAALLTVFGLLGRDLPEHGVVLASARLELFAVLTLTACAAAMAGLLASALVGRTEHTMPILVVSVMAQLVLSGGLFSIGDRPWLQAVAVLSPTRWGFAAAGSSVDLRSFRLLLPADALWVHTPGAWALAMAVLAGLGLLFGVAALVALRRREQRPSRRPGR